MNFDPRQFLQMIKSGQNPQQLMIKYLESQANQNPMTANLLRMAREGDSSGLEQFARNLLASQGKDFDTEFNAFKQQWGFK